MLLAHAVTFYALEVDLFGSGFLLFHIIIDKDLAIELILHGT